MVLLEDCVGLLVDVVEGFEVDVDIDELPDPEDELVVDQVDEVEWHRQQADDVLVVAHDGFELEKELEQVSSEGVAEPDGRSDGAEADPQQIATVFSCDPRYVFEDRLKVLARPLLEVRKREVFDVLAALDQLLVDFFRQIVAHA